MWTSTDIQITFSIKSEVQKVREEADTDILFSVHMFIQRKKKKVKNAVRKLKTVYMEWKRKEIEEFKIFPFMFPPLLKYLGWNIPLLQPISIFHDIVWLVPKYFLSWIYNHGT